MYTVGVSQEGYKGMYTVGVSQEGYKGMYTVCVSQEGYKVWLKYNYAVSIASMDYCILLLEKRNRKRYTSYSSIRHILLVWIRTRENWFRRKPTMATTLWKQEIS